MAALLTAAARRSARPAGRGRAEQQFDLISVTNEEALGVEASTFTISPTVVTATAKSHRIARELEARGIDPVRIDYRSHSDTRIFPMLNHAHCAGGVAYQ